ncbi:MAG: UPF0179 family protein [Candidatus Bathyarchaeia archaeon]
MEREKPIVTLIGVGQADVGRVFIHKGPGSLCGSCKYFQICVKNLEPERIYKIVKIRKKTLPCEPYKMDMRVVEVTYAEIPAVLPSNQAIEKAIVTFLPVDCKEQSCKNYEHCVPLGLRHGDKCQILTVIGNLQCSKGLPLKDALLRLVPVS